MIEFKTEDHIEKRLQRRLKTRWLRKHAKDPQFHTPWVTKCRRRSRVYNRMWAAIGKRAGNLYAQRTVRWLIWVVGTLCLVGLVGGLVALVGFAIVVPSLIVTDPPTRSIKAGSSELIAVALTRCLACFGWLLGWAILLAPGRDYRHTLVGVVRGPAQPLQRKLFGPALTPRREMRSIDLVKIAVLASLTFYLVTSIGVIVRFESSISAATGLIVLASLFGGAVSWLVWSVSVRLLGVRLPGTGQVGVVHWLIIFWGFFGAFLLMALSGRLVVFGADWILKTRILGEQWNVVQAITGGQFKHATGWTIVCSLAAFLAGNLSLQCTGSWQYLRHVAAVRRPRPLPAGYDGSSPARDSKKDYSARLQTMLAGEMESRRYPNWRTWLWPRWLAKRWGYVVFFWLFAVSVQTGLSMWMNYMQQFDTVQIVGGAACLARRPENMLPYFSSMLLLALFAATELLVMIDQGALTARGFRDRPISVRALWLQTQVRHFCSAPVQLFLVGSVSLVCCLATRAVPEAFTPHAVIVLMAIKFAAATYGTASQVETSGSQLASGILRLAVRCLLLGLGAVIAMAFGTNALLLVAIDYGTAGLAWAAAVGCAATLAVLGIAVAELRWAERVHVPGGHGQDPGGAK